MMHWSFLQGSLSSLRTEIHLFVRLVTLKIVCLIVHLFPKVLSFPWAWHSAWYTVVGHMGRDNVLDIQIFI